MRQTRKGRKTRKEAKHTARGGGGVPLWSLPFNRCLFRPPSATLTRILGTRPHLEGTAGGNTNTTQPGPDPQPNHVSLTSCSGIRELLEDRRVMEVIAIAG